MNKIKREIKLLSRFSLVGILNTTVGYLLMFALMFSGVGPYLSNLCAYGVGFIVAFLLNKNFVFRSKGNYLRESILFLLFMGLAYLFNLIVLYSLLRLDLNPYLSQLSGGAAYSLSMYLFSRKWVFLKVSS
ncbi:MAG: GtrA family protein [Chlamydiia bacterium]|nr:GtrA family protein [Chlamydiia bacterium]